MKNIETIIQDYLSDKTEYALQITSNWGTGKTYYYRHTIERIIGEQELPTDARKKYKPIYISLFGLKSIEDIATKIVVEFYQSKLFSNYFKGTRKKRLQVSTGIFKIGLRGFLNLQKWGNSNDYLTDITEIGKNTLDGNEILICFDDLERIHPNLKLADLIGYVNNLVDEGVKVLIISNEDVLKKSHGKHYPHLKEKVIGITIPFLIPPEEIIKSIIESRFILSGHRVYGNFLLEHIDVLKQVSNAISNNYRHLIYALKAFQKCYSHFQNDIFSVNHEISELLQNHFVVLMKTSLAFAIEYKASKISHLSTKDFDKEATFLIHLIPDIDDNTTSEDLQSDKKIDFDDFIKKYKIRNTEYQFYPSLFDYLINYNDFDINLFIDDFRKTHKVEEGNILPEYEIINKLSYSSCLELTDQEYTKYTTEMLSFAKKGKYLPSDYLTVVYYLERFNNPLSLDIEVTIEEIKKGFLNSIQIANEKEFRRFNMSWSKGLSEVNQSFFEFGRQELQKEKEERDKNKIVDSINFLLKEPRQFLLEYWKDSNFRHKVNSMYLFKYINIPDFMEMIKNTDKVILHEFKSFVEDRYDNQDLSSQELEPMLKLRDLLVIYLDELNEKNEKFKSYHIEELIKLLSDTFPNSN